MKRTFHVIIEEDEDGGYVGRVPELAGCLSQGDTLDELMRNIKEAIELCLEVEQQKNAADKMKFVGVQEITALRQLLSLGVEGYAVQLYIEGRITLREAAELNDIPVREMLDILAQHGVTGNVHYDVQKRSLEIVQELI